MTSLTDAQVAYFDESSPANIEIKMGEAVQTLQNTLTGTVITDITGDVTINSSKVSAIGSGKVTYANLDSNTKSFYIKERISADTAATDTSEKSILSATLAGMTIVSVAFIPDAGFGQVTNFSTISVINKGTNGLGTTVVAHKDFTSAVTAFTSNDFGVIASATVTTGQVLTVKISKTLLGQITPAGSLVIVAQRAA